MQEWDSGHDALTSVVYDHKAPVTIDDGTGPKRENAGRVTVHYRKVICREIGQRKPVLLLDGTGDIETMRLLFGKRMREVSIRIERKATVTQITDKVFSRTDMLGRNDKTGKPINAKAPEVANRLRREVADLIIAEPSKRKLVVTYKPLVEPEPLPDGTMPPWADFPRRLRGAGIELTHFGAFRGMDKWRDHEAVFIVGREQPPSAAVEGQARAWYAEDREPLVTLPPGERYPRVFRGRRMRGGRGESQKVSVHPDPRVQRRLEQRREHDITQGADRLRLIFNETRLRRACPSRR